MTESRAVSVVLAVGMLIAGAIALFAFGPLAVNVLLTVVVSALLLERTSIFRRVDLVWEDTDKALQGLGEEADRRYELELRVDALQDQLIEPDPTPATNPDLLTTNAISNQLVDGNPPTNPVGMPAQGPATEEAIEVAARQVRQLMEDGEMEERTVTIGGVQRTYRVRVERDAA